LFTEFGEDTSTVSFDPGEPALGRIKKIDISPPHTPATIKRCIARAEKKSIYAYMAQLYPDISSETLMDDGSFISLFRGDCVGSTADKPMVLVQPERRAGLYNVPIKVIGTSQVCLYINVNVYSLLIISAISMVSGPRLAQSSTQTGSRMQLNDTAAQRSLGPIMTDVSSSVSYMTLLIIRFQYSPKVLKT
jgi:hypothetical protein